MTRTRRPRAPTPVDDLSPFRARAALALLAFGLVVGFLARPAGLILVVLAIAFVAFEPGGTLRVLFRRARGRPARDP